MTSNLITPQERDAAVAAAIELNASERARKLEANNAALLAKFSDLATEMEKHSNDHIHAQDGYVRAQAAVEAVCADRIRALLLRGQAGGKT